MADGTKIEWTDATLNVVNGCSVISPGCANCYAMRAGGRNLPGHPSTGLTVPSKAGHVWTGEVRFNEKALILPLRWKRPRTIFWNAHGDLFHDSVPDAWIDRCFAVVALTPHHKHQVLTKRSARMRAYTNAFEERANEFGAALAYVVRLAGLERQAGIDAIDAMVWPLLNVWLGVSVEDQKRADERIPDLLSTPAVVRFLSCEPLLGHVDLDRVVLVKSDAPERGKPDVSISALRGWYGGWEPERTALDWVIVGGESGPGSRPMHPDWARSLRDQCAAAGVPMLFKQWGDWASTYDRDRDDPDWQRCPKPGDWDRKRWLNLAGGQGFHGDKLHMMSRFGKRAAGRLLDGVQHDGMPS